MTKRIGFIGIGLMGHGMTKNLLEKGFSVITTAHRNRAPLEDLLGRGATEAAGYKEIAEQSDIVFICVTGAPEVEAVIYGDGGVLAGARPGLIVVDCSTSEPAMTERVNADLSAKGVAMADAPLARTPIEAEAGRLNTMVGASEETFAAIEPALETFCENIFHVGPVGAGHKTKLINNFMAMGQAALIAEALCACAATGVDLHRYYEVVSAGGANSGIFQLIVPKAMDEGDFSGLKFSLLNAEKDLRYYTRMTGEKALSDGLGRAVHAALAKGLELGLAEGFVGHLIRAQEQLNGLTIIEAADDSDDAGETAAISAVGS
jgi:3-hydroxyisobutyrate dehydrogenase-like beta-hydroxyacid dehydrogenase